MQEKTSGKFIEKIGKDKIRIGENVFKIKDWNSEGSNTVSLVSDSSENFTNCLKKFQDINIGSLVSELDREIKGAFKFSFDHTLVIEEVILMEQFPYIGRKMMNYYFSPKLEYWNLPFSFVEFFKELLFTLKAKEKFKIDDLRNYMKYKENDLHTKKDFGLLIDSQEVRALNLYQLENILINGVKETMKNLKEKYTQTKNELKIPVKDSDCSFILKQYLIGFSEFVRKTRGEIIYFEVETANDGLIIKIEKNKNFEEIKEELSNYWKFIEKDSVKFDDLKYLNLNIEQLFGVSVFLNAQILNFQHQYKQLLMLNNSLEEKNNFLKEVWKETQISLNKSIECSQNNQKIEVTNNNYLENKNSIDINIQVTQNIEKLQENMCDLKRLLTPILDENSKEELKEIVNELVNIKTEDELKRTKGFFLKLNIISNISPQ